MFDLSRYQDDWMSPAAFARGFDLAKNPAPGWTPPVVYEVKPTDEVPAPVLAKTYLQEVYEKYVRNDRTLCEVAELNGGRNCGKNLRAAMERFAAIDRLVAKLSRLAQRAP